MRILIAEVVSGCDSKQLAPYVDAIEFAGGIAAHESGEIDCFVLPWTRVAADATHVQAWALKAAEEYKRTGKPLLYWLPFCDEQRAGFEAFFKIAVKLPKHPARAMEIMVRDLGSNT